MPVNVIQGTTGTPSMLRADTEAFLLYFSPATEEEGQGLKFDLLALISAVINNDQKAVGLTIITATQASNSIQNAC